MSQTPRAGQVSQRCVEAARVDVGGLSDNRQRPLRGCCEQSEALDVSPR